ncbi:DUF1264 domain-containing protein [Candidatus Nitronereus thalassa]|uniref:DUF1264 domain-containing protein n=1 Tax=Candidatus Nitronereus thalassa TaxID=3020898 RepID=A0ABU3K7N8_9BACT|nr:DUF1264 domain-containing protein [Candidatus Nitronereus thalassa]MDT7042393.1 DUF1264 domain-containing protein [Candidatus Nitronereus thalassa]
MIHTVRLFTAASALVFLLFGGQAFGELQYFTPGGASAPTADMESKSASSSSHDMGGGSPAVGYDIHVQAPHMMEDGTPGGPYHHYCKGISDKILQCLLFESTAANAPLVAVEYFVAKDLARTLPVIQWHRYFHDHKVEIATGRVQILDIDDPAKVKAIAEAASATDGVIYHLWKKGLAFPDGSVSFPQSLGHSFPQPQ